MSAKRRAPGPAVTRKSTSRSAARSSAGSSAPKAASTSAGARPSRTRARLRKVLKWVLIVGLVGTLILIGGFVYLYKTTPIPDPNKDFQTQTSFVYYADGKTQVGTYATQNRQIIPYSEMTPHLRNAVVAAEDRTFWTNHGIDPKGILRAAFNDARGGATQGASTITQQYVKILYLTQERSINRKIHEAILSLKLQKQLSKQEILQGYLNTIYFGRGAYGVQAAAQAYFGVDAQDLTLRQSAVIASVLNNPSEFDPANGKSHRAALLARYRYVLAGHGLDGHHHPGPGDGCEQEAAAVPGVQAVAGLRRPEGPHALDGAPGAAPARLHRRPDRRRWPAGHHHVHAEGDGGGQGRGPGGPAQDQRQAPARRGRLACSPAPARWSASSVVRTTCAPRSTGPRPAAWSARRSSRSPWRPASPTATRSRAPGTATRPTSSPTACRSTTRGRVKAPTTAPP